MIETLLTPYLREKGSHVFDRNLLLNCSLHYRVWDIRVPDRAPQKLKASVRNNVEGKEEGEHF